MRTKKIKILIFTLMCICFMFMIPKETFAGTQNLNSLDFQVNVKENGDLNITEIWNVDLEDTNTLFKTFSKDERYDGITDVTVSEIEEGAEVKFQKSDEYNYHVEEDYYQALENPDGDFEIAWGVDASYDIGREFKISYTVLNHVSLYNDCAEIYWQLIGRDFQIYCDEITGTINLPNGITNIEDLRVWAHGPLNGTITRENEKLVKFNVSDLPTENYLEIRLAVPNNIFTLSNKNIDSSKLQSIINEEMLYAEEANAARELQAKQDAIISKIFSAVWSFGIVLGIVLLKKNLEKLSQDKKIQPDMKLEYFRDIPDNEATPAEAGFIYYTGETELMARINKILSATMLNLSLKGWLEFNKRISKKEEIEVILKDNGKETLKEDEELVYNYLLEFVDENKSFTMKEFEKKATKNIKKFEKLSEKIGEIARIRNVEKGIFDEELKTKGNKYAANTFLFSMILMMLFMTFIYFCAEGGVPQHNIILAGTLAVISVVHIVIGIIGMTRHNGLTQKGVNEAEKWNGLRKYMQEFSLLNEREVPELVLWEKYLVYATAFGVAEKVIEQLKVKFPEMADDEYLRTHCTYMYFVSDSKMNFINNIDSSIGSVNNYSSGGGAGGGFSAGGGAGGGFSAGGGGGR